MEDISTDGENDQAPRRAGCLRRAAGVGLGLLLGALAGVVVGVVAGVSIAMVLGVL